MTNSQTSDVVGRIFSSWKRGRAALLYGPPGTGKTHVMSELFNSLDGASVVTVDPRETADQALSEAHLLPPIPDPHIREWITFHQSYSYEDFVVGLRPVPTASGGVTLQPRMGRLLDLAWRVSDPSDPIAAAVLCIDELNRGNAAGIFGELITYLDADYRADAAGGTNPLAIPLHLPGVGAASGNPSETEPLIASDGGCVALPRPWFFPHHVYIVASMNSVDRSAIPLDSALARRFDRIELRADPLTLARWLGLDSGAVDRARTTIRSADSANEESWTLQSAEECAVLLLEHLNYIIGEDIGDDFQLGHGLLRPVVDSPARERWGALGRCWDDVLLPQLQERYQGRPDLLARTLRLADPPPSGPTLIAPDTSPLMGRTSGRRAQPVLLEGHPDSGRALCWLLMQPGD